MIKNITLFIKNFGSITRFLQYQHNIFYALLPLFYFKSNFIDVLIIYFTFLFLYMFSFMINDYADVDTDTIARKYSIAAGIISRNNMLLLSLICLIISYTISLIFYSIEAFLFLLFGTFLSYSYSAEPFRLKKKSIFGLPVAVFAAGPAGILYTCIAYGFNNYVWIIIMGIISFLHIAQTQILGGIYDFEADEKAGMFRRLEQIIGKKKSIVLLRWLERILFLFMLGVFIYYNKLISFIFLLIVSVVYSLNKMKLNPLKKDKEKFNLFSFQIFGIIILLSLLIFCWT